MLSGQVILRDTGGIREGKKLFMVFGVIGLSKDTNLLSEHQYTIKHLELLAPIDRTEITEGDTPDGLLIKPIWRI